MIDLRDFLGEGAASGQKLKISWFFGAAGTADFQQVTNERLKMRVDIDLGSVYKSEFDASVTVLPHGKATIEVNGQKDDQAQWEQKGSSLDLYSKLFPRHNEGVCVRFWRDGKYTNAKVWVKKLGIWWDLVHVWILPVAAAGTEEAPRFDQETVHRLPGQQAT